MAKKRVYEIAKERGVTSKELLESLQAAGIDVKAAASTVEESDVARTLSPSTGSADGKAAAPKAEAAAPQRSEPAPGDGAAPTASPRPQRPAGGGRGPSGNVGRRRRVVIDSQASRRQPPPPQQQQRRRRSRGRGAPPPEPSDNPAPTAVVERPIVKIPSGATVRDVAEHLGLQVSEVI